MNKQEFFLHGLHVSQMFGRTGLETTITFTMVLPKYILNASMGVKKRVGVGVRELVNSHSNPKKNYECVVHTSSRDGLPKDTAHGTVRITINFEGFFSKSNEVDIKFLKKKIRKLYKEISLFPEG